MSEKTELHIIGSPEYYEAMLKKHPKDEKLYSRLMVLYRQQKEYKKELNVINNAIRIFEPLMTKQKSADRKVNNISSKLNKVLGLTDSKGKTLYEPKPLSDWRKRKETVLKKLKK